MYDHELHDVSCNLYDSIEALKREPITVIDNKDGTVEIKCAVSIEYNKDDWEQIAADPANGEYLSLLDLPKYEDGSSGTTSIGDCLLSSQDTINNNLPSQTAQGRFDSATSTCPRNERGFTD